MKCPTDLLMSPDNYLIVILHSLLIGFFSTLLLTAFCTFNPFTTITEPSDVSISTPCENPISHGDKDIWKNTDKVNIKFTTYKTSDSGSLTPLTNFESNKFHTISTDPTDRELSPDNQAHNIAHFNISYSTGIDELLTPSTTSSLIESYTESKSNDSLNLVSKNTYNKSKILLSDLFNLNLYPYLLESLKDQRRDHNL